MRIIFMWPLDLGRREISDQFRAGQVKLEAEYDTEFVRQLCSLADRESFRWERWENGTDSWITASWCRCIL